MGQFLIFIQIPCSSSDASLWLKQTIKKCGTGENIKQDLILPQQMTQQHQLENYSINACREDQKKYCPTFYSTLKNGMNPTKPQIQSEHLHH